MVSRAAGDFIPASHEPVEPKHASPMSQNIGSDMVCRGNDLILIDERDGTLARALLPPARSNIARLFDFSTIPFLRTSPAVPLPRRYHTFRDRLHSVYCFVFDAGVSPFRLGSGGNVASQIFTVRSWLAVAS